MLQIIAYNTLTCRPRPTPLMRRRWPPGFPPPKPTTRLCGVGSGWKNPGRRWLPVVYAASVPVTALWFRMAAVAYLGSISWDKQRWRSHCRYKRNWLNRDLCQWWCRSADLNLNPVMPSSTKLPTLSCSRHAFHLLNTLNYILKILII